MPKRNSYYDPVIDVLKNNGNIMTFDEILKDLELLNTTKEIYVAHGLKKGCEKTIKIQKHINPNSKRLFKGHSYSLL